MKFFIFLTFCCFLFTSVNAQDYDDTTLEKKAFTAFNNKEYDTSILYFKLIEKHSKSIQNKIYSQHALGHIYGKEKLDLQQGIYWLKKNINTIEEDTSRTKHFTYLLSLQLVSNYFQYLGKSDSAEFFLKKGCHIYTNNIEKYKKNYSILNIFNTFFYRRKEYNLSKEILNTLIEKDVKNYSILSNYLSLCIQINDTVGIKNTVEKINHLDNIRDGIHFFYLGELALNGNEFDKAILYFNSFIKQYNFFFQNAQKFDFVYSTDELKTRHYYIARTYLQMSQCYRGLQNDNKWLEYLLKAKKEIQKGLTFPIQDMNVMASEIYRALDIYHHEHEILTSINYIDSAQQLIEDQLLVHQKDTNQVLLNQLILQNFYKAEFSGNIKEQEKYYWQSYLMLKEFVGNQYNDDDQLYQFKNLKDIQNQLVIFFTRLYRQSDDKEDLYKVLEIIENSKSNILYKRSQGLENLTFEQYINTPNIDSLRNKINSPPLLSSLEIKKYFKEYYDGKSFVSYYPINEGLIMVGYIDGDFFLETKCVPDDWNSLIKSVHKELSESNLFIDRSFNHQLLEIGEFLVPEKLKNAKDKRVVFSPSGNLTFIPFEILKTKKGYYLEQWAISYSFSLHHEYSIQRPIDEDYAPIEILGVAPYNKINLPFSLDELKTFTDNILSDKEASMENTLNKIYDINILHLATHTTISKTAKDSNIEFYPGDGTQKHSLSFNEVANKNLSHLQLVSLSSCHSADGPYIDGEGILSLQRAFAYASVHSILASKWDVNDEVSSIIMASFYDYIKQGWEKDIALQKAKKDFWSDNPSLKINPIYWGNIVLFGDSDPISSASLQKTLIEYLPFEF
ncbi:CHAT domain-containing protein [Flammeovirga sp. SJP92]|uniref:CHAT domain-containing protein n=1 Tax=Flammeovirga sp. SJP92 TaxID=1775430 RepID=UPI0015613428|nr:CHAT domain-containing protein [Flammeovirga sp. SJP92]